MLIIPKPHEISLKTTLSEISNWTGYYSEITSIFLDEELKRLSFKKQLKEEANLLILFEKMAEEEYYLEVKPKQVVIKTGSPVGAFYALQTFKQIFENALVNCLTIHDYPDLKTRGIMLDISRGKVLSVTSIKKLIDIFASLKINHLELYVEGFSYDYPSFPNVSAIKNYLGVKDYLEIEKYAESRFIDFVPNENGFGHMTDWLAKEQYHKLAECPEGFTIWGSYRPSSTLNPLDEGSFELVKKMYMDMLPYYKSKYFNMNFDEPYELGFGKSKKMCDKIGEANVYIEYFRKLAAVVRENGKTPLLWGDFLIKHPEVLPTFDKDAIFIDWGYYKNYDFMEHAKILSNAKLPFMMAPGTCTWSVITSREEDMKQSIEHSSSACKKYHGLGILTTDWGDFGHLQYLPFSMIGFIYGAMCSWGEADYDLACHYLEKLYGDISWIILKLSRYTDLEGEYHSYGSRLFAGIQWAESSMRVLDEKERIPVFVDTYSKNLLTNESLQSLKKLLRDCRADLMKCKVDTVWAEVENSISLLETLVLLQIEFKKYHDKVPYDFSDIIKQLEKYKTIHKNLWLLRNISAGYEVSAKRIDWLIQLLSGLNGKETL